MSLFSHSVTFRAHNERLALRDRTGTSCPGTAYNDDGKGRFYFVGCEAALLSTSATNEWTYSADFSQILWRPPPDVSDPNLVRIHGKNTTWAIVLAECTQTSVRGIQFWGTTIGLWKTTSGDTVGVDNTVEDCTFDYPVASRRSLREVAEMTVRSVRHLYDENVYSYDTRALDV